jgi:hypothetical protein
MPSLFEIEKSIATSCGPKWSGSAGAAEALNVATRTPPETSKRVMTVSLPPTPCLFKQANLVAHPMVLRWPPVDSLPMTRVHPIAPNPRPIAPTWW